MAIHTDDLDIDDGNDRIVSPGAGNAEAVIAISFGVPVLPLVATRSEISGRTDVEWTGPHPRAGPSVVRAFSSALT